MREIKIGEQTYEVHYGQNAICALEDELGASIIDILSRIEKGLPKLLDLRAVVWAGMLAKRRNLTPDIVGNLLDSANVRIRDVAMECVAELSASFTKYILTDDAEQNGDTAKND